MRWKRREGKGFKRLDVEGGEWEKGSRKGRERERIVRMLGKIKESETDE